MRISDWSSDVCSSDLPALREQTSAIAPSCGDAFAIGLASHDCGQFIALPNRPALRAAVRSEEHTSELQSLMRISYAVFCLKKKMRQNKNDSAHHRTQVNNAKHVRRNPRAKTNMNK